MRGTVMLMSCALGLLLGLPGAAAPAERETHTARKFEFSASVVKGSAFAELDAEHSLVKKGTLPVGTYVVVVRDANKKPFETVTVSPTASETRAAQERTAMEVLQAMLKVALPAGTETRIRRGTTLGYPSADVEYRATVDGQPEETRLRVFVTPRYIYSLLSIGNTGWLADADSKKLFDSFKLVER